MLGLQFDEVAEISFRRLHDNISFCYTTVSLPPSVARGLRKIRFLSQPGARSRTTILALLERVYERPLTGAKQTITAIAAPPSIAPLIDCAVGEPVLRTERLYFDADSRPVEFAVAYFNPARYSYRIQLQRTSK
jgi:DNA-binding GntR family transcriptional regulator